MSLSSEVMKHYYPLNRQRSPKTLKGKPLPADVADAYPGETESEDAKGPTEILRGDVALAAVVLDAINASPGDLENGVHVIYVDERLIAGVKKVIETTSWKDFHSNYAYRTGQPKDAFWINGKFDEKEIISALQSRSLMIGIGPGDDTLPDGFGHIVDREWIIPELLSDHVESAIKMMTGVTVSLPADRGYDAGKTLKALRPGVAPAKIVADLKALHRDDWSQFETKPEDVKDILADLADKANRVEQDEPVSLGNVAKKVVTRLRDLSGYGDAKDWGMQLAADLAEYKAGNLAWEDVDKGLLLSGPPGCGKTFYARALAEECKVPLILSSYADWESATGGGNLIAKAIKKCFTDARKKAPCIVFIDEIDSVGSRGKRDHNSGWFDVVINALLAELDGAEPRNGVVVIGATNHPDQIDSALLRPGRLDRHIAIPRPTIGDLNGILVHHLGDLEGLDRAARHCRGLSPAEIAQVARDARRLARTCKRKVCAADVSDVIAGKRGVERPEFDRIVCVHEAGHALVYSKLGYAVDHVDADNRRTLAALPSGSPKIGEIERHLAGTMGGRAAEIAVFGEPSTGAVRDLEQATSMAYMAVAKGGLGGSPISLPDEVAIGLTDVRKRVEDLLMKAMALASKVVAENRSALDALAAELAEKRYLDALEIKAVIGSVKTPPVRTIGKRKEVSDDHHQLS